ncbi:4'-phosphopantetheinyl transferase family protein [Rhizobium sp. SL86]|uniref:4'-phosphopantetheinyl transferase family protein n=1 Tax=Rhizobium sp. SL86 TaxID=2995148 RepID=UPI002275D142|nr:4'-phosphopantetheinyl transferase superfamily protein [Rhizobium sp. SL86]MCY1667613.1 4'-phosphopantetheinyl transferase superfamily protein [Rhizobium sp. SL86]
MRHGEQPRVVVRSLSDERPTLAKRVLLLPAAEQAEAARYLRPDDRDRFLVGRLLLRDIIAAETALPLNAIILARDAHGRPCAVQDRRIDINLSHSGDRVVAAIGRDLSVGIDVEQHRAGIDFGAIGRQVFTPWETRLIAASGAAAVAAFFAQWTLKEALIKALGRGFLDDPRRLEIRPSDAGSFRPVFVGSDPDDVGGGWTLVAIDCGDGHAGALAFRPRPPT